MRFGFSAFFYGVIIYALSYLATNILLGYGVYNELLIIATVYSSFAVAAYAVGRSLRAVFMLDIVPYAATWTVTVIFFDVFAIPGVPFEIVLDSSSLLAYFIVFSASLLSVYPRPKSTP